MGSNSGLDPLVHRVIEYKDTIQYFVYRLIVKDCFTANASSTSISALFIDKYTHAKEQEHVQNKTAV